MTKTIISCAITGSVHTPTMSPYPPCTPEEIAAQSIAAAQAGAAIIHLHARNPADGSPSPSADVYMQFLPRIAEQTDAVLNITTGGSVTMTLEQRLAALRASSEMASLNMGSINFAMFRMAEKPRQWKHDWEVPICRPPRTASSAIPSATSATSSKRWARRTAPASNSSAMTSATSTTWPTSSSRAWPPPFLIQSVFGVMGGIGADPENVLLMKQTADRLFGKDYVWSLFAAGSSRCPS